jgi:hypothetical protein
VGALAQDQAGRHAGQPLRQHRFDVDVGRGREDGGGPGLGQIGSKGGQVGDCLPRPLAQCRKRADEHGQPARIGLEGGQPAGQASRPPQRYQANVRRHELGQVTLGIVDHEVDAQPAGEHGRSQSEHDVLHPAAPQVLEHEGDQG